MSGEYGEEYYGECRGGCRRTMGRSIEGNMHTYAQHVHKELDLGVAKKVPRGSAGRTGLT